MFPVARYHMEAALAFLPFRMEEIFTVMKNLVLENPEKLQSVKPMDLLDFMADPHQIFPLHRISTDKSWKDKLYSILNGFPSQNPDGEQVDYEDDSMNGLKYGAPRFPTALYSPASVSE